MIQADCAEQSDSAEKSDRISAVSSILQPVAGQQDHIKY